MDSQQQTINGTQKFQANQYNVPTGL